MIKYLKNNPTQKNGKVFFPPFPPASVLIANHKGPTSPQQKQLVVLPI